MSVSAKRPKKARHPELAKDDGLFLGRFALTAEISPAAQFYPVRQVVGHPLETAESQQISTAGKSEERLRASMKSIWLLAVIFLGALSFKSSAQSPTGDQIQRYCEITDRVFRRGGELKLDDIPTLNFVDGYIKGMIDGADLSGGKLPFNIPKSTTPAQISQAIEAYINKYPRIKNERAAVIISAALAEAFPSK